jgi:hypothetical protein
MHVRMHVHLARMAILGGAMPEQNGGRPGAVTARSEQASEVRWRKSSASNPSGNCVELAALADGTVAVRNSRHPAGPALVYTRAEVAAFLAGVRNGEFDDLG